MISGPSSYLNTVPSLKDEDIDLARAALSLASLVDKTLSVERYENHLQKISQDVAGHYKELLKTGETDGVELQLAALAAVLSGQYHYTGDTEAYDDLQNASLIRVIERRKGLPITLSIIYIHAARAQGWNIAGLDFPGHFICRLEKEGKRLVFDPFNDGQILEAPDLRALVKKVKGPHAELDAHYFEPATNRGMLLRLQNNIKYRQIEAEDYKGALETVESMKKIDPEEPRLLLDAGVLYAKTGQPMAAIAALENYLGRASHGRDRHDAELLLREIRKSLN